MKTMTCKQLKGACDKEFHAESAEEMVKLAQEHGMEMMQKGDKAHIEVMEKMREEGKEEGAQDRYMAETKEQFDALPEDK